MGLSNTIAIRIDEEIRELIESLSVSMNLNQSQLLRKAFKQWARTRKGVMGQDIMICDRILVSSIFEKLDDKEILEIAETTSDKIISKIRIKRIEDSNVNEKITDFLEHFTALVGPRNLGWFSQIDFKINGEKNIVIYALHSANLQYSKYSFELISNIVSKLYDYEMNKDKKQITDNSLIIAFNPLH
ncbi:MAG: hypothetical protein ACLFVP_01175 [Candidatus Bathyarchaeia archaeon]